MASMLLLVIEKEPLSIRISNFPFFAQAMRSSSAAKTRKKNNILQGWTHFWTNLKSYLGWRFATVWGIVSSTGKYSCGIRPFLSAASPAYVSKEAIISSIWFDTPWILNQFFKYSNLCSLSVLLPNNTFLCLCLF